MRSSPLPSFTTRRMWPVGMPYLARRCFTYRIDSPPMRSLASNTLKAQRGHAFLAHAPGLWPEAWDVGALRDTFMVFSAIKRGELTHFACSVEEKPACALQICLGETAMPHPIANGDKQASAFKSLDRIGTDSECEGELANSHTPQATRCSPGYKNVRARRDGFFT